MKRLSDYTGAEAIELWADLLEEMASIFGDEKVQKAVISGQSLMAKARAVLDGHEKEAVKILERIDPTPVNGLNLMTRLISLIKEFQTSEEFADFFGLPAQETMENGSSGYVTENTQGAEN